MVVGISHDDFVVPLVDSHSKGMIKLAISLSIRPKLKQELAISIKDLNAMVGKLSYNNFSSHIARQRIRAAKLPITCSL